MKFTPEDEIIMPDEARYRSEHGCEDSMIREPIRNVMCEIRRMSYYGFRKIGYSIRLKTSKEMDKILKILTDFNYDCDHLEPAEKTATPGRYNYYIEVKW